MTKQDEPHRSVAADDIIDRIYEIALNPEAIEDFVDHWSDLNAGGAVAADVAKGSFDAAFKTHLDRAEQFLQMGDRAAPLGEDPLAAYQNFAAFIIDEGAQITACNAAASTAFGIQLGCTLDALNFPADTIEDLHVAAQALFAGAAEQTLKSATDPDAPALLMRLKRIADSQGSARILVTSTKFEWRDTIASFLGKTFGLTPAEQAVTRGLAEGADAKDIARTRKTSVATVRGQIKVVARKLNLRTQADIVRFTMAIAAFDGASLRTPSPAYAAAIVLTDSGLKREFHKPFKTIALPDGRRFDFHDMGPASGNPILVTHMGSCMVRWSRDMLRQAFAHNLRVICPIRAGFGCSDPLPPSADVLKQGCDDMAYLLSTLGIIRLPLVVQGSDFPFGATMVSRRPDLISEVFAVGGKPSLPGGAQLKARGRWQQFFVSAARNNPQLLTFASNAVMAMSRRVSPETMLTRLCKDSPADLEVLQTPDIREALIANIEMMAHGSPHIGPAFAREYLAFESDQSAEIACTKTLPIKIIIADQDPTIDLRQVPLLEAAYPWMSFEIIQNAGLALLFQNYPSFVPVFADAAARADTHRGT